MLVSGGANWTNDSWTREENVVLTIASGDLANAYHANFEELWQKPVVALSGRISAGWSSLSDGTEVRPYFCPGRADKLVHAMARSISTAQKRIRIFPPALTSRPLLRTLPTTAHHP